MYAASRKWGGVSVVAGMPADGSDHAAFFVTGMSMPMLRRQNLGTLFVIAGVAEILAFVAVVDWVGLGPALAAQLRGVACSD